MAFCKDPRLTYLNQLGYNVVRLPRKGIVPLGVIGREKKSKTWLGTVDQIWECPTPPPSPGAPRLVAGVQGSKTNDLDVSIGLDILKNTLSGMFGAAAPSIDFAYKNAKSVQFVFREVRAIGIDPFVIGNFLASGTLRVDNPFVRFFEATDEVEAWIVAEVLESRAIGVTAKQAGSGDVTIDVPQLQALLGTKVGVKAENSSNTEITYEGTDYLAFGYLSFGVSRVADRWNIRGIAPDAEHSFHIGALAPIVEEQELVELTIPEPTALSSSEVAVSPQC